MYHFSVSVQMDQTTTVVPFSSVRRLEHKDAIKDEALRRNVIDAEDFRHIVETRILTEDEYRALEDI